MEGEREKSKGGGRREREEAGKGQGQGVLVSESWHIRVAPPVLSESSTELPWRVGDCRSGCEGT